MEETKVCTNPKCPKPNPQPISEFNKNVTRPSGRETRCRTCTAQVQRDRKIAIEKASSVGGRQKKQRRPRRSAIQKPGPATKSVISEAVALDAQLLKAVKKSVANQIIKIIQEAFE